MRVTANMSADNSIYNLQQGRKRIDKLQETITSGQNINTPSDNSISSRLLLDIGDKIKVIDQYSANINKAQSWMKFNDTALTSMNDIILSARKLISTINAGTALPSDRQGVHDQLLDLKKAVVDMANTQYGDQYIFGGTNNTVPPFKLKSGDLLAGSPTVSNIDVTNLSVGMQMYGTGIPVGTTIAAVTAGPPASVTLSQNATATAVASSINVYAGNGIERQIEIAAGTTQTISVSGDRLLQGGGSNPNYGAIDILQTFDDLMTAVGDATTPSTPAAITPATKKLDDASRQLFSAINMNLSRMTRVDSMAKLQENNKNTLTDIIGKIQNPDMVKLGVQLNTEQNAFEASLSTTAKLVQLSILDFM